MTCPPVAALIVAAGRGERMGSAIPKQFLDLAGKSVLAHALGAFAAHPMVGQVLVVLHEDDADHFHSALRTLPGDQSSRISATQGGTTRQQSVRRGLRALAKAGFAPEGLVLIHDAARPLVSESLLTRAIAAGMRDVAAIPVLPVVDTIAGVDGTGTLSDTPDRGRLRIVQTPQVFHFAAIYDAHEKAKRAGETAFTDDSGIARWAGHTVTTYAGCADAFKLTTPDDFTRARRLLARDLTDIRSATGYDVHTFGPGDHIMLGGVRVPHDQGVVGHSDADVLLHALTDALLGCIADGDIGVHFPPSDMTWKGAASRMFLAEAVRRVHALGGEIRHLDGTVVCEAPRVGPYRDAMRALIAEVAGISLSRVGLKATTSEKMGFTGRREGIAALATATVALPEGRS